MVPNFGDEDIARRIERYPGRRIELSIPAARAAELPLVDAGQVKILDAVIARVDHVDNAIVDGDAPGAGIIGARG